MLTAIPELVQIPRQGVMQDRLTFLLRITVEDEILKKLTNEGARRLTTTMQEVIAATLHQAVTDFHPTAKDVTVVWATSPIMCGPWNIHIELELFNKGMMFSHAEIREAINRCGGQITQFKGLRLTPLIYNSFHLITYEGQRPETMSAK